MPGTIFKQINKFIPNKNPTGQDLSLPYFTDKKTESQRD